MVISASSMHFLSLHFRTLSARTSIAASSLLVGVEHPKAACLVTAQEPTFSNGVDSGCVCPALER